MYVVVLNLLLVQIMCTEHTEKSYFDLNLTVVIILVCIYCLKLHVGKNELTVKSASEFLNFE